MLPTSNFVGGLRVKGTKQKIQKNTKLGQIWALHRSRDPLLIYEPQIIAGYAEDTNVKFCSRIDGMLYKK